MSNDGGVIQTDRFAKAAENAVATNKNAGPMTVVNVCTKDGKEHEVTLKGELHHNNMVVASLLHNHDEWLRLTTETQPDGTRIFIRKSEISAISLFGV